MARGAAPWFLLLIGIGCTACVGGTIVDELERLQVRGKIPLLFCQGLY